jgi:CheY-like chemotaxis protein
MDDTEKSQVPLIAISGNARNYSLEDFKEAGFNEYLQKPLNFDELVEMVKKYTNN